MSHMTLPKNGLLTGSDEIVRCWWCGDDEQYLKYHDEEWGLSLIHI